MEPMDTVWCWTAQRKRHNNGELSFVAAYYDRFTDDVGYSRWADYFEPVFPRCGFRPELVLDLACGTGTLSGEMARRGYEMIGVDASPEMLMQAMNNTLDCDTRPVFLHQRMEELDLYGTIHVVLCCLDSVNYVTHPLPSCVKRFDACRCFWSRTAFLCLM